MHSKTNLLIGLLCFLLILGLAACTGTEQGEPDLSEAEREQTAVAETTAVAQSVGTLVAGTVESACFATLQAFEATLRAEPTHTATLDETPTPTPAPPMVSVSEATNCRTGPGQQYEIVGTLQVGEQAEVVGVSQDGDYWVIALPRQTGQCWIIGIYATVTGDTSGLPILTPQLLLTATLGPTLDPALTPTLAATLDYNWTGTWTTSQGLPGASHETFMVTLTQTNLTVTGSIEGFIDLNGTLSPDGSTLTGTWSDPPASGPFEFKMINLNQFTGNINNREYEWCGYRNNAGVPSPCMGP